MEVALIDTGIRRDLLKRSVVKADMISFRRDPSAATGKQDHHSTWNGLCTDHRELCRKS